ncbi:MAG: C69 family dipeptidase [Anaerolineales bacterium]|nr:C69 family dipeptidase [Anaerolineales bacterium]
MCNNVVALGNATADGSVLFGKNSDREPNEAHYLRRIPRAAHAPGSVVQCTYIEIPQVAETNAVLLAQPCWIWGAEMGANDQGVVIGNTAVYSKVPYETGPGLIGMDFLRLALERANTAYEALEVITTLLEKYGQGGNDGFSYKFFYHNSFLIADMTSAWKLETAGQQWAAQQIKDVGATTNALTITTDYDLASKDLVQYAISQGWCKSPADFNFKQCYSGPGFYASYLYTLFGRGDAREKRLLTLLNQSKGQLTPKHIMNILRDHGAGAETSASWSPGPGMLENTVCMHAGFGPIRVDQTCGSMVSRLTEEGQIHWATGSAAPCTSIFKPVWVDTPLPDIGPAPTGRYNHTSLWWRHESLYRAILQDYAHRLAAYHPEQTALEDQFITSALAHATSSPSERAAFSAECFAQDDDLTERWTNAMLTMPIQQTPPWLYRHA